jgi:hypothetical protein
MTRFQGVSSKAYETQSVRRTPVDQLPLKFYKSFPEFDHRERL